MSYGYVSTNMTDIAVIVRHCERAHILHLCVSVCCFEVPGSLGNNWCKSSINFTDRGVLCASFTYWAPVCWVIICSRCTIATKYHSCWDAFYWFGIKVNIHAGEVAVLGNSVILYLWEVTKAFPFFFPSSPHSVWLCEWDFLISMKSYKPDICDSYRWRALSCCSDTNEANTTNFSAFCNKRPLFH